MEVMNLEEVEMIYHDAHPDEEQGIIP